jgi:hypothetical protein
LPEERDSGEKYFVQCRLLLLLRGTLLFLRLRLLLPKLLEERVVEGGFGAYSVVGVLTTGIQ